MKRPFTEKKTQVALMCVKTCSPLLVAQEMQIKTLLRNYFCLPDWQISASLVTFHVRGRGKPACLYIAAGSIHS